MYNMNRIVNYIICHLDVHLDWKNFLIRSKKHLHKSMVLVEEKELIPSRYNEGTYKFLAFDRHFLKSENK